MGDPTNHPDPKSYSTAAITYDPDLSRVVPTMQNDQERKLVLQDLTKLKVAVKRCEANKDETATTKKRGINSTTHNKEMDKVKIAKKRTKDDDLRVVTREALLPHRLRTDDVQTPMVCQNQ